MEPFYEKNQKEESELFDDMSQSAISQNKKKKGGRKSRNYKKNDNDFMYYEIELKLIINKESNSDVN